MANSFLDIQALNNLLANDGAAAEQKEVAPQRPLGVTNPGEIGGSEPAPRPTHAAADAVTTGKGKSGGSAAASIWDVDDVAEAKEEIDDGREMPEYEILYKQLVSAEDQYLGIGQKHEGSDCTDALVVLVELPGTKFRDVTLDVTETVMTVRSPKFKLNLSLPRRVNSDEGNAKWDGDKFQLRVQLPVVDDM